MNKIAVVLFNLGGPDSLDAVQPFLENLFNDPDIFKIPFQNHLQNLFLKSVRQKFRKNIN
ncbi:MAG: ferrochelatase [Ignavibacteriales bacterium]|nr:ferrochelatase [Ignavibacteriales bacterium]